ncbi:hypothetical protein FACS1894137_00230 [Spirochaetia bacterium]|nr:hypothetical protein FACS1894137_00230 [Spirochaetia bacterium]
MKKKVFGWFALAALIMALTGCRSTPQGGDQGGDQGEDQSPLNDFVYIQGGTFTMGSPETETGRSDDEVQHQVTVSGFYMGKYEVSQAEYKAVIGNNPSYFKGANRPVEWVSWLDAIEYCNKRSIKEGLAPAYRGSGNDIVCDFSASGYRLPTEAEWEYAAKGGIKNYLTYEYAGGNNVDPLGWYTDNSREHTHNVGKKAPNSLGLYDMSGNVWEWCWDWYGEYSKEDQTDPAGAASGSNRVLRGGGGGNYAQSLRSANRESNAPSRRSDSYGFRVVRP